MRSEKTIRYGKGACSSPETFDLVAFFDGDDDAVVIAVVTRGGGDEIEIAYGDVVRPIGSGDCLRIHKERLRGKAHAIELIGKRFDSPGAARAAMNLVPLAEFLEVESA